MNRLFFVFLCCLGIGTLLDACRTSATPVPLPMTQLPMATRAAATAPSNAPIEPTSIPRVSTASNLRIFPVNLQIQDAGDGWKEATLNLAYINTSAAPIHAQCLVFGETPAGWQSTAASCPPNAMHFDKMFVETAEGKTYPAEVAPPVIVAGDHDLKLPVPPQIPFRQVTTGALGFIFETVKFRFAQAAHPTAVVLSGANQVRLSLDNVPAQVPAPDWNEFSVQPVSALKTETIAGNSSKVKITFDGTCVYHDISGFYQKGIDLPYTLVNTNALDEENYTIDITYAAYFPSGGLTYWSYPLPLTIGPGQTEHATVTVLDAAIDDDYDGISEPDDETRASHLVVFGKDGATRIYDLTSCPSE